MTVQPPPSMAPATAPGRLARGARRLDRWRGRLLLALFAVLLAGIGIWQYGRLSHVTETDARVMADMITMSSRIDGWVSSRPVTDGQTVAAGETVAIIDQREAAAQLDELQAKARAILVQQARTRTQLHIAEATQPAAVTAAEARKAADQADLAAAHSERERARLDFQRADALVGEQFISRQAWDLRRSQFQQAEEKERAATARLAADESAIADAKANLAQTEVLRQELQELGHEASQIDAQIHQKEIDLDDRVVKSPADAVIDQKFVEPGEYVIPGQRLLILHDPKAVWIEANVKETKLADLAPGQPVEISVDAFPSRRFEGTVERVGHSTTSQFALLPSPNPSGNFTKITQRVPVRIRVRQPADAPLRPGMMVEVDIDTAYR